MKQVIFIPDTHAPHQHTAACGLVEQVIADRQPDMLVHLGDLNDNAPASRHGRKKPEVGKLQEYVDASVAQATAWQAAGGPGMECYLAMGNHDEWINRFIANNAPMFDGARSLDLKASLELEGWTVFPYQEQIQLGEHLYVTHDMGRSGKSAVTHAAEDAGGSVIFGHTHKLAVWYSRQADGSYHVAINAGCLADPAQCEYAHKLRAVREMHLGFAWGVFDTESDLFRIDAIPVIINSKGASCIVGDRTYHQPY